MNSLQHGVFRHDELIRVYAPPNLHSVMPGNKVMLRSGGPCMIVDSVIDKEHAYCSWDENGVRVAEWLMAMGCNPIL
jgi:uncharacterized protein YodC (DUF2158 family)